MVMGTGVAMVLDRGGEGSSIEHNEECLRSAIRSQRKHWVALEHAIAIGL